MIEVEEKESNNDVVEDDDINVLKKGKWLSDVKEKTCMGRRVYFVSFYSIDDKQSLYVYVLTEQK